MKIRSLSILLKTLSISLVWVLNYVFVLGQPFDTSQLNKMNNYGWVLDVSSQEFLDYGPTQKTYTLTATYNTLPVEISMIWAAECPGIPCPEDDKGDFSTHEALAGGSVSLRYVKDMFTNQTFVSEKFAGTYQTHAYIHYIGYGEQGENPLDKVTFEQRRPLSEYLLSLILPYTSTCDCAPGNTEEIVNNDTQAESPNHENYNDEIVNESTPTSSSNIHVLSKREWLSKITLDYIKFYERGDEFMPYNDPDYKKEFNNQDTRFISWEMKLNGPAPGTELSFRIHYKYYYPNGSLMGEHTYDASVLGELENPVYSNGWGYQDPGQWRNGFYKVEIYIDDQLIGSEFYNVFGSQESTTKQKWLEQVSVEHFKFFEAGKDYLPYENREYKNKFKRKTLKYACFQIDLRSIPLYKSMDFVLEYIYRDSNGIEIFRSSYEDFFPANSELQSYSGGFGSDVPGDWKKGQYGVEIFIGGKYVTLGVFEVY